MLRSGGNVQKVWPFKTSLRTLTRSHRDQLSHSDETRVLNNSILSQNAFDFLDSVMSAWKKQECNVHPTWARYFKSIESGKSVEAAVTDALGTQLDFSGDKQTVENTVRTIHMIRHFQKLGHFIAKTEPLGLPPRPPFVTRSRHDALQHIGRTDLSAFGFSPEDAKKSIRLGMPNQGGFLSSDDGSLTIQNLYERLTEVYAGSIGVEYLHIHDRSKIKWIRNKLETPTAPVIAREKRMKILDSTLKAVLFEKFAGQKFATMKRFGLDGCESLIVGMRAVSSLAKKLDIQSILICMSHRGRLNTMVNVMQKSPVAVFGEFLGKTSFGGFDWGNLGDVKYHMGVEHECNDDNKHILMTLIPNPSHLESADAVCLGHARARQDSASTSVDHRSRVLPILIHGDASMAGQGVVYETLQLSGASGYSVGGTLHVVVNNQIGFTTDPADGGSGNYCTDLAKAINCPVFHVNADDPEAVAIAMEIALEYRQTFGEDVFIDLIGYRRHGHNELDMPHFTQPIMYQLISKHPTVLDLYSKRLIDSKVVDQETYRAMEKKIWGSYEEALRKSKDYHPPKVLKPFSMNWHSMATPDEICAPRMTGVPTSSLRSIGLAVSILPDKFEAHKTIKRVYATRAEAIKKEDQIDFGLAEALAFGTLLKEGFNVRLAGQDSQRGTFSHRHAVVHDQQTGDELTPLIELCHSRDYKGKFTAVNSILSEFAAMGFEYGYAMESPNGLNIWEAQFGDFANGGQIVVDQFLSSGEVKWNVPSGLVLLMPHGYDGQGPEHSSGRIERFLNLCDDREDVIHPEFWSVSTRSVIQKHNMQVCYVSTPSNFFHVLRRQMHRGFRKPLVLFMSKRLLRMKEALSPLSEFDEDTRFARYITDPLFEPWSTQNKGDIGSGAGEGGKQPGHYSRSNAKRLILCTGQLYYDLVKARKEAKLEEQVVISRIEQLSPFPFDQVANEIDSIPHLESVVWAQEEPMNQGAWNYVNSRLNATLQYVKKSLPPLYVGRDVAASTATGDATIHNEQLKRILEDAMDLERRQNSYFERYVQQ